MPTPLVAPFRGERFSDSTKMSDIIAPPYDVLTAAQRNIYANRHPHNIVHLTLPAGNGDKYANAARTLAEWREVGALVRDAEPSVYAVEQTFDAPDGRSYRRTGVIAAVAAEPYAAGRVKPHERTHRGPKVDRLELQRRTRAMFEALLMMSRDESGALLTRLGDVTRAEPTGEAALDGAALRWWRVSGEPAEDLARAAAADGALYIADGHHRYETAGTYREEHPTAASTLGLIVPVGDPGLVVLPTHRLIDGPSMDADAVRSTVDPRVVVRPAADGDGALAELERARGRETAAVIVARDVVLLATIPGDADLTDVGPDGALDIAKIDMLVVQPLRAVADLPCRYTPDAVAVRHQVAAGEAAAGVVVNPTPVDDVLAVADAGGSMPQKSTYFAPKAPSGLTILSW